MLKNAGIKSKTEAVQRLINGEKFYWEGQKVHFDPSYTLPFRWGDHDLFSGWYYYECWEVKFEWYDALGEGVLCWVWDGNQPPRRRVGLVERYDPSYDCKFRLKSGEWYEHAQPVTAEEVKKFLCVGTLTRS